MAVDVAREHVGEIGVRNSRAKSWNRKADSLAAGHWCLVKLPQGGEIVTALRKLGLPAEEGEIAILSGTTSSTGTPPDFLAAALQKRYGRDGLIVEYRAFKDVSELRQAGLTLAVIKFSFLVDHYVTVLQVTDSQVIVGDPLGGVDFLSYDEFRGKWRFTGVVLKRP